MCSWIDKPKAKLQSKVQGPNPKESNPLKFKKENGDFGLWAVTKILWARGPQGLNMFHIPALSNPHCQEGVPSHSRWTAR